MLPKPEPQGKAQQLTLHRNACGPKTEYKGESSTSLFIQPEEPFWALPTLVPTQSAKVTHLTPQTFLQARFQCLDISRLIHRCRGIDSDQRLPSRKKKLKTTKLESEPQSQKHRSHLK
jgi:hypothetical protein